MPIFEYKCSACGHDFELLVLASDRPACPECESEDLEKQLSLSAMSSDGTRKRNLAGAKERARKTAEDKAHAEHDDHHHHHH